MPTVLIFGGSGKVARLLTKKLVATSYTVHSIIRNPDQSSDIEALGAKPIVQDVEKVGVAELKATIEGVGPDVVVWAAGAGGGNPERTKSVDRDGAIKSFDATAAAKGVQRYIIVSALDIRDRTKPDPEWYDEKDLAMSKRVWGAIGPYMECKFAADKDLVTNNGKRGLDYTIVRPGGLNTEEQKGKIEAGKVHLSTTISREDVAEVVLKCIEDPGTIGLAFDVVGGETTIDQALKNVVAGKIDTFEGYY